ncbi:MAG: hypothetical protein FWD02_03215 [Bacteroidales bacterium]|nr:hypothetical protein [Bacteroidales bacterium]
MTIGISVGGRSGTKHRVGLGGVTVFSVVRKKTMAPTVTVIKYAVKIKIKFAKLKKML